MSLYVQFAIEERPRSVRLFLKQFYSRHKDPYTAYPHNTYNDPGCRNLHCDKAYRSFDDLYELVKTYYPSITLKQMVDILLTTKLTIRGNKPDEEVPAYPHLAVCCNMNKIRFIPYRQISCEPEYINLRMRESQWTWRELLNLVGIKNKKDLEEYIKNSK